MSDLRAERNQSTTTEEFPRVISLGGFTRAWTTRGPRHHFPGNRRVHSRNDRAAGVPRTRSTPSAPRQSNTISEPLRVHDLGLFWRSGFGFLAVLVQPRHHSPQLRADFFDRVLLLGVAQSSELLAAGFVFFNPLAGESAVLNARQDFFHLGAGLIADDHVAASKIAVFGGVGDRVAHAREATFVDEVDDQFHLV